MVGTLIYDCGWKVKWIELNKIQTNTTLGNLGYENQLPLYPGISEIELKSSTQVEFEELINRAGEKFAIIRTKLDDTWEHIYDKWIETVQIEGNYLSKDFLKYLKLHYKIPYEYK